MERKDIEAICYSIWNNGYRGITVFISKRKKIDINNELSTTDYNTHFLLYQGTFVSLLIIKIIIFLQYLT